MLSRKHYVMIAKAVAEHNDGSDNIAHLIRDLAIELKLDNSRFDKQRFIDACNWKGGL